MTHVFLRLMAFSESVQRIYVENSANFISSFKTKLTTVYEVGLFNSGGLNLFNIRLYSRFLPNSDNLDEYLNDSSDLKTGLYKAVQSFIEATEKTSLAELTSADGRTTRFHKIFIDDEDYFLTLTYDRNYTSYQATERLIDNLFLSAEKVIKEENSISYFKQTGNVSVFDNLALKLVKIVNVGYNNSSSLSFIEQLQREIENNCKPASFFGKESIIKANEGLNKLKKLKMLFPQLNINFDYYENYINSAYERLNIIKEEQKKLSLFRKKLIDFGEYLLSLTNGDLRENLKSLSTELMFPSVFNGVSNDGVLSLKEIMKTKADYLSGVVETADDTLLTLEAISIKDWIKGGFISRIPSLTNY